MRKIIISGGPHSGKTTLFESLRSIYTDAWFVEEPATRVIRRELTKAEESSTYRPIAPWIDYSLFGPIVVAESIALEDKIPRATHLAFLDRSLIDGIAYSRLNDCAFLIPDIQRHIRAAEYTLAFFCEQVGDHAQTDIRRETADEAKRTRNYLAEAYAESDIPVIHLPAVSVRERLDMACQAIDQHFS
jgi:predicted ATPase